MGNLIELPGNKRPKDHFLVTVAFKDGEKFGRVYTRLVKAQKFANRQMKSRTVKSVQVQILSSE